MAGPDEKTEGEDGVATEEASPELQPPRRYKVVLMNDDFTPMEFVIEVLETFFRMDREKATRVMLMVHTRGKGVCGIFGRDVAETKVAQVNQYARQSQHPLLCEMEEA